MIYMIFSIATKLQLFQKLLLFESVYYGKRHFCKIKIPKTSQNYCSYTRKSI